MSYYDYSYGYGLAIPTTSGSFAKPAMSFSASVASPASAPTAPQTTADGKFIWGGGQQTVPGGAMTTKQVLASKSQYQFAILDAELNAKAAAKAAQAEAFAKMMNSMPKAPGWDSKKPSGIASKSGGGSGLPPPPSSGSGNGSGTGNSGATYATADAFAESCNLNGGQLGPGPSCSLPGGVIYSLVNGQVVCSAGCDAAGAGAGAGTGMGLGAGKAMSPMVLAGGAAVLALLFLRR